MRKHLNPYRSIKTKTLRDWHYYWVSEDREFFNALLKLDKLWSKFSTYEDAHPEIVSDFSKQPPSSDKVFNKLISAYDEHWNNTKAKFGLDDNELSGMQISNDREFEHLNMMESHYIGAEIRHPHKNIPYHKELVVRFNVDVTHKEYVQSWKLIKNSLNSEGSESDVKKRRRAPDDTQLVYAVFKARQDNNTYKQIFVMYQEGELPGYVNKPTNQFKSDDSLEAYYQKYRPDKKQSLNA